MADVSYSYVLAQEPDQNHIESEISGSSVILGAFRSMSWDATNSTLTITFKQALSSGEKGPNTIAGTLDYIVENAPAYVETSTPELVSLGAEQPDKALRVAIVGRVGTEVIVTTHNFCDPTTWFGESTNLVDVPLVDQGNGLIWGHDSNYWINMVSGLYLEEDDFVDSSGNSTYGVTVKVDGVTMTQIPMYSDVLVPGDYVVDYKEGRVRFRTSQAGKNVTASFHKENGSTWYLKPKDGKILSMEKAEAQFSTDSEMYDTLVFSVLGYACVFSPTSIVSLGGSLPDNAKIPLKVRRYKTYDQVIDEMKGAYPQVQAIGGPRGSKYPRGGGPFNYGTVRSLSSTVGIEAQVYLENNTPFRGERVTTTFYCVEEAEPYWVDEATLVAGCIEYAQTGDMADKQLKAVIDAARSQ